MDRGVGVEEVGAARMKAVVVELVAGVVNTPSGEEIRPVGTGIYLRDPVLMQIHFVAPQGTVERPCPVLAGASEGPAVVQAVVRRPFANQQGVAGAIGDFRQSRA